MASQNPNRLSTQLSPFEGRQSPFRRQNSQSPATATTIRGGTPTTSPTKNSFPSSLSPTKAGSSLSPEKTSPFVRRPSQISNASERPASPFARPTSSWSVFSSPSRQPSAASQRESTPDATVSPASPVRKASVTPAPEETIMPLLTPSSPAVFDGTSSPVPYDGAKPSVEDNSEDSGYYVPPSQANLRPTAKRNITSSTAATIKPPVFSNMQPKITAPKLKAPGGGAYNHIPQPLLHSMRESFEVLDSNNTGTVTSAAVSEMLSQLGLDNNAKALKDFFPPNGPAQLNLARYLEVLSGPLSDLSQPEELRAAFEAFDVDDSGQIDVAVLRDALLHTAPQPGDDNVRLSEREVDNILGEFAGRRAFGTKGLSSGKMKGEVFRYRDFMAGVSGTTHGTGEAVA
ncbi:hypothetical protein AC578_4153 [Pseudocercospora eumusae]|uniref:EF-hand domain-containing protein n=1 Tax=Pseudocercospora eumusae TaxID=321146 RepID=A0A139HJJ5_9PEZI|nr:hypothetical protein AC578_4153 [Pseudocercospora eumusae]